MAAKPRTTPLLIVLLIAAVAIGAFWVLRKDLAAPTPLDPASSVAHLGSPPDWSRLDPYQETLTREEFTKMVEDIYTIGPGWEKLIRIGPEAASITTRILADEEPPYILRFAPQPSPTPPPRYWRSSTELPPAPPDRPLEGLRIAIDPGHIGGAVAQMEARWFQIGDENKPVMEGEMTLLTAQLLKPRLEALGASVQLVRSENAPVTTKSVADFEAYAAEARPNSTPAQIRAFAERLFYRTSEIRARAKLVNEVLQPDLVLCLHFNAEGWGDPLDPQLSPRNHFHIILNGAYTLPEVQHDDERLEMLLKITQRIHPEEKALARDLVTAFQEVTALPPYEYEPLSLRAIRIGDGSYIWARNLLANRLYECPVLFLEPYVMNSEEVHARVQAGDYEGIREVAGAQRPSLFREYADAVTLGLQRYYETRRTP